MTPEFDEEVVFEVGAGATRGGLGPCLSAPFAGALRRDPRGRRCVGGVGGCVCVAGRAEVTVGREAGARGPAGGSA